MRGQIEIDHRAMRYMAREPALNRLRQTLAELEEALAKLDGDGA
ncbi:MAG TPA: hypothetical protein VH353_03360 [Caulobacteraceae bacterium]|nr:hypothetical protein [Caulobacteraceae bacterium]